MRKLLILGCGYVGERLAGAVRREGVEVVATTRRTERASELEAMGVEPIVCDSPAALTAAQLAGFDGLLDSIPLSRSDGGAIAPQGVWLPQIASRLVNLRWAGYLSTTAVYGDAAGGWVDEGSHCSPTSERGRARLSAERGWLNSGLPAEVFRIAGIYGPGRNILSRLKAGDYKAVSWKPPHWSNRIHVDDIVTALLAAIAQPRPGRIVNLSDDEPLPHADYVTELARMIGAEPPVLLTPEEGVHQLSPMALEFFRDNKRVSNRLLHQELLSDLKYPSFRDAVADLV